MDTYKINDGRGGYMYEEKNTKYYHIRANVFWIVVALIGILFIGTVFFTIHIMSINRDDNTDEYVEKTHMEYGHIDSKLENKDQCYLCGNASGSLMGYYRKFDTVGVIGLNEWYVLDLRLKEYDSDGNPTNDSSGSSSSFGNTSGIDFHVNANPTRAMSRASIESTNGSFDKTVIENNLCQECLDKVTETLEGYFEKGKEEYQPFCLVDFATLDIYPMQEMNVSYSVRDYWVELDHEDSEIEIGVYYLPIRE